MTTERRDNFYEGAAGKRELGKDREMTTDTVFAILSCPKAVTGVTVMPLVEEGKLSLDDPATKFVSEIAEIQMLEGVDDTGEPRVRPTDSYITVNQMMLHIVGFGYDFFNEDVLEYRAEEQAARES